MDYKRLEKRIGDMVEEEQAKLGYRRESIRLYYPLRSLNGILGTRLDAEGMAEALRGFGDTVGDRFGAVTATHEGERFCILLPPETSVYIHKTRPENGFLRDFIAAVSRHPGSVEAVLEVFYRCSGQVHVERVQGGDYDYLVFFEDGCPDDYRYCLTVEGEHVTYHRFAPEDFADL